MYLVDSDVLIQAKNAHYGFDLCPGFWDWLDSGFLSRTVASVDQIGKELARGNDRLTQWAASRPGFFLPVDQRVAASMAIISQWARSSGFTNAAIDTFLKSGDLYLVSHAMAYSDTVVTHETPKKSVDRIKIPSVCQALSVGCMNPYRMLEAEGVKFVLQ